MLSKVFTAFSTRRSLRRLILPLLERFNPGDIRIRHHYTGRRLRLHSYRHKGYWFHGRRREETTMEFFRAAVEPGGVVVEVGGHIGYIAMWLAELAGETGRVLVFEPGHNNLPYLRANLTGLPGVEVAPMAVSDVDGTATFYEEQLTGQNNSLLGDYEPFECNRKLAFSAARYSARLTPTVRLDTYLAQHGVRPDLIKIDVEGAESLVLAGAAQTLVENLPLLVVEVTRHAEDVWRHLTGLGYVLFSPEGRLLTDVASLKGNVCAAHPARHRRLLAKLGWSDAPSSARAVA